jgi:hypothetical protein
MNENVWYVYQHIRLDKNQVFYIGIGKQKNYRRAYDSEKKKRNKIWIGITGRSNWKVEIVCDKISKGEAALKEQELIKLHGRIDNNTGYLCNMTDGGDGIWNCIVSEETRKKRSESMSGSKNYMFGKSPSAETRLKKSITQTGQKRTEITKIKQSLASVKSGQAKPVRVTSYKTGEYIGEWYAISEACRVLNIYSMNSKASLVAQGKRKQTKGYVFEYI